MAPDLDLDRAGEFVLALMALELHDDGRAWKGYPWEVLAHLNAKGLISDPRTKAKSVVLTHEGETIARAARNRLLLSDSTSDPTTRAKQASVTERKVAALTDLQQHQVETLLTALCRLPDDPAVRSQLRHGFRVEGLSVILFASRPAFRAPHEWRDEQVAKFTYVKTARRWKLFCMFRDLKWRGYQPLSESPDLALLVDEVRRDPTAIFWG